MGVETSVHQEMKATFFWEFFFVDVQCMTIIESWSNCAVNRPDCHLLGTTMRVNFSFLFDG